MTQFFNDIVNNNQEIFEEMKKISLISYATEPMTGLIAYFKNLTDLTIANCSLLEGDRFRLFKQNQLVKIDLSNSNSIDCENII